MNVGLKILGAGRAFGEHARRLERLVARFAVKRKRGGKPPSPVSSTATVDGARDRLPLGGVGQDTTPAQALFKDL